MALTLNICRYLDDGNVTAQFGRQSNKLVWVVEAVGEDHPTKEEVRNELPSAEFTIGVSAHPENSDLILETLDDFERMGFSSIFHVSVTYSTTNAEDFSTEAEQEKKRPDHKGIPVPWNRPVIRDISHQISMRPMIRFVNDSGDLEPLLLSNGLPPSSVPMVPSVVTMLKYTKYIEGSTFAEVADAEIYVNKVSTVTHGIYPAGHIWCVGAPSTEIWETTNGVQYYYHRVVYTFKARLEMPWTEDFNILNASTLQIDPAAPNSHLPIVIDTEGNLARTNWPLDANGKALSPAAAKQWENMTFTETNQPRPYDFTPLNFDWPNI